MQSEAGSSEDSCCIGFDNSSAEAKLDGGKNKITQRYAFGRKLSGRTTYINIHTHLNIDINMNLNTNIYIYTDKKITARIDANCVHTVDIKLSCC